MASPVEQTFDSGVVAGTAVTSSNAPSPSVMATPVKNAGTTINFETAKVLPGSTFSGRIQSASNNAGYFVYNWTPATATTRVSLRWYVYFDSNSGANNAQGINVLMVRTASAQVFNVAMASPGEGRIYNSANAQIATLAGSIPQDQWVRIEADFTVGTTTSNGQLTVRTYLGESTTPHATLINAANVNLGTAAPTVFRYGWSGWASAWTLTGYYSHIRQEERASGSIGPRALYSGAMEPVFLCKYGSSANVTTSGAVALTTGASVGDLVVVSAALGSTGLTSNGVTDSKGNTYTRLDFAEQTTVGTTSAIYYSILTTALTTSDTITLSRAPTGGVSFVAYKISGVDPVTPFGTPIKANGNSVTPSAGAIAVPAGGIVLSSLATQVATTVTAGPDFTYEQVGFATSTGSGNPRQAFASWSWLATEGAARLGSAQGWALVAVPVNPASSGPPEGGFAGAYSFGPAAAAGDRDSDGGFNGSYSFGPALAGGSIDPEGTFAGGYAFGPAAATGKRSSDGNFASSYSFGPASAVGDRSSDGGFAAAYGFGPAAADGAIVAEGGFAAAYSFGPAAADGTSPVGGDFATAYSFGPAEADGSASAAGDFAGSYAFGPASAAGDVENAGVFAGTISWGPATFDGETETSGAFDATYGFGPATADGSIETSGGFATSYAFGPATASGAGGAGGGFSTSYGWGPAEAGGSSSSDGTFETSYSFGPAAAEGSIEPVGTFEAGYSFGPAGAAGSAIPSGGFTAVNHWGPALAGGSTDPLGTFATSYHFGPARAHGSIPSDLCWPDEIFIRVSAPSLTLEADAPSFSARANAPELSLVADAPWTTLSADAPDLTVEVTETC